MPVSPFIFPTARWRKEEMRKSERWKELQSQSGKALRPRTMRRNTSVCVGGKKELHFIFLFVCVTSSFHDLSHFTMDNMLVKTVATIVPWNRVQQLTRGQCSHNAPCPQMGYSLGCLLWTSSVFSIHSKHFSKNEPFAFFIYSPERHFWQLKELKMLLDELRIRNYFTFYVTHEP